MPSFVVHHLHQTAVLWEFTGSYDDQGMQEVAAAAELAPSSGNGVRWKYVRQGDRDAVMNGIAIDAIVVVAQTVPTHSVLWLGTLASWLSTGSDNSDLELMEVVTQNVTTTINNRNTRRTLGLRRFRETLPNLV